MPVAQQLDGHSLDNIANWPAPTSDQAIAWQDLKIGMSRRWMWFALAMQDIRLRYRGSILGPFWLSISTAVMIVSMGLIYGRLFHQDVGSYLPFLTTGLVFWQFISTMIIEGCQTFLMVATVIQQVPLPFSIHAYRTVCRNVIVLAHNLVFVPIVMVIFGVPLTWNLLLVPPAFILICINGVWVSLLLGMIAARFRDVPPIIASFIQVVFFVTPIFWPPSSLGRWAWLVQLNPLFAFVDVVRTPFMGHAPAPYSWLILIVITLVGCTGTFLLFARFRSRVAYWI
jgi:ABC-2 type transport system permease protein/lipopolysaccharide transport system permease protein